MGANSQKPSKLIEVNLKSLGELLSFYKFPLALFIVGLICVLVAGGIFWKDSWENNSVVFQTEYSQSARKKIKVDIQGEVAVPGVYEFDEEGGAAGRNPTSAHKGRILL